MYIYEGHMGSLFASPWEFDPDECYCETCGDSDRLIGYAETREEAWELLKDDTDIDGSGGWNYECVQDFLRNWDEQEDNE